jgi:hypothetical protein
LFESDRKKDCPKADGRGQVLGSSNGLFVGMAHDYLESRVENCLVSKNLSNDGETNLGGLAHDYLRSMVENCLISKNFSKLEESYIGFSECFASTLSQMGDLIPAIFVTSEIISSAMGPRPEISELATENVIGESYSCPIDSREISALSVRINSKLCPKIQETLTKSIPQILSALESKISTAKTSLPQQDLDRYYTRLITETIKAFEVTIRKILIDYSHNSKDCLLPILEKESNLSQGVV